MRREQPTTRRAARPEPRRPLPSPRVTSGRLCAQQALKLPPVCRENYAAAASRLLCACCAGVDCSAYAQARMASEVSRTVRPFIGTIGAAFRRRSGASEGTGARVTVARTTGFAAAQPDFATIVAVASLEGLPGRHEGSPGRPYPPGNFPGRSGRQCARMSPCAAPVRQLLLARPVADRHTRWGVSA